MVYILWMQLQNDISIQSKNGIKKLLLDCLLNREQNGLISKIVSQAKLYLQNDKSLAKAVFNTIVMLVEDEMQHQVYKVNYVKKLGKKPDFKDFLQTIYQLRIEELLPHILISLNEVFAEAIHEDKVKFAKFTTEVRWILDMLVLKAFVYQSDDIKNDNELARAFEGVLQSMVELDNPKAAVISDEFRIH